MTRPTGLGPTRIAFDGQTSWQQRHWMHAGFRILAPPPGFQATAPLGQTLAHSPHPVQAAAAISGTRTSWPEIKP